MALVLMLLSILAGIAATVAALFAGLPLWLALALYPLCGAATMLLGAVCLVLRKGDDRATLTPSPVLNAQRG